jgi:NADP-dependent aldehyde dehydrogenase
LIARAMAESGLPRGRLEGERGRTAGQLRLFARMLRDGLWQQVTIDSAQPEREPAPRPDLRQRQIALGPVAVFGASNFPLAFSVAGGDTASALAAGCPVIVKAHPSHPGTSEMVARVIQQTVVEHGLPEGTFSMVGGPSNEVGALLVSHPAVQAVGFTGSRAGGLALCRLARERAQPIPVYAEMSSINPIFLLPAALSARAEAIAAGYVDSLLLGVGQFCTNPGLVLGVAGPGWDRFVAAVSALLPQRAAGTMLSAGIHAAYGENIARLARASNVQVVATGKPADAPHAAVAWVHQATASVFMAQIALHDEVFGPSGLLVSCQDTAELRAVAERLEGQLTATLQMDDEDLAVARQLLPTLERKAGRILANGFPTGVEVSYAMVHGGPFPASSDSRSTSVGARAIERFLRPVCYQGLPAALLPELLHPRAAPGAWRLVDGAWRCGPA